MIDNPAMHHYRFWREVIRFHGEYRVERLRKEIPETLSPDAIESWSIDREGHYRQYAHAPINYRLGLAVSGLSAKHLVDAALIGPLAEQYEPIITVNMYVSRGRQALMTAWPNGEFQFHVHPHWWIAPLCAGTFLRSAYAVRKRVYVLPQTTEELRLNAYCRLDEKNYTENRLYLPKSALRSGGTYELVYKHDQWIFVSSDPTTQSYLDEGYGQAERRYARHKRRAERDQPITREKLAVYIPKHGRMTGLEAVDAFSTHMRTYPALKPEEATDGDCLVSSPVH
jgi:hypothetical protein